MTPPEDLRVRVEAAFPGAIIHRDDRLREWMITPVEPFVSDRFLVHMMAVRDDGIVGPSHVELIDDSPVESSGASRLQLNNMIEERLRSVSAHEMIAARRRLGL